MKFKNYLTEKMSKIPEEDIDNLVELIKKDCQPFLKDMKNSTDFLYSGRSNNEPLYFIKDIRTDRSPLNTPIKLQEKLDELFQKKFGVKARSQSLFVTGKYGDALDYGRVFAAFPIGDYKIIWSKYKTDLYDDYVLDSSGGISSILNKELPKYNKVFDYIGWKKIIRSIYTDSDFMKNDVIKWTESAYYKFKETPDISLDDFIDQTLQKIEEIVNKELEKTVNTYQDNDLPNAILSNNEIMLMCKKVYLVNTINIEDSLYDKYNRNNDTFQKKLGLNKVRTI